MKKAERFYQRDGDTKGTLCRLALGHFFPVSCIPISYESFIFNSSVLGILGPFFKKMLL